jgi:hypothetical protein
MQAHHRDVQAMMPTLLSCRSAIEYALAENRARCGFHNIGSMHTKTTDEVGAA